MLRIGDMLVGRGLITQEQLDDALFAQRQFGGRVGTNLIELGYISDDELAACLSEQLGVPYVKAQALGAVPREVIARLPKPMAEKYRAVPLRYQAGELHLALADPQNFAHLDELNFALTSRIRPYVVTEVALNYALERYYGIRREARLMQAAATGLRDLHAPPSTRAPMPSGWEPIASGPGEPLPNAPPATLANFEGPAERTVSVVDELAAVMTAEDVVNTLFRYFTDLFAEVVILAVTPVRATPLRAGSRARVVATRVPVLLTMAEGTLLRAVIGKPQIIHQPQIADPEISRLCAAFGVP